MLMQHSRGSSSSEHTGAPKDGSHSRAESIVSDETKQMWQAFDENQPHTPETSMDLQVSLTWRLKGVNLLMIGAPTQDDDNRFDDLMRSGSTMKLSLTPDRLRTMEVLVHVLDYICTS
jgi:hypothetical protein